VSEAEERWAERRRRAQEHGRQQLEAAEERRGRDLEAAAAEKAFDWRRQQLITEEWGRLREEERVRRHAANRRAYRQQMVLKSIHLRSLSHFVGFRRTRRPRGSGRPPWTRPRRRSAGADTSAKTRRSSRMRRRRSRSAP